MRLRSNSFNLEPIRDVMRPAGAPCPLASEIGLVPGAPDPRRAALLRLKDRMRLFVTLTRDFDDDEIAQCKALGQLYVDRSRKQWPDDFSVDLAALAPMSECEPCSRRAHCPGAFRASSIDVFTLDEARTLELVGELEGDVLDVGAGDAPYLTELAPRVEAGRARYLALDPDAKRLALLRARHPWAEVLAGSVDDLPRGRSFRHVLLLRSLNHVPDPRHALAVICERVDTGGTLLIVDDVAFGLIRSVEQVARGAAVGTRFEHYRNDSAAEVIEAAAGLPLRLVERRDVAPGRSNQWLLRFERV